jgi:hypothetical protein
VERAIRPFIRWTPLVRTSPSSMRRSGAPSRSSSSVVREWPSADPLFVSVGRDTPQYCSVLSRGTRHRWAE